MPSFFCLLAGLIGVGIAARGSKRRVIGGLAIAVVALVLGIVLWPGWFFVEKMLTDMALPLGFVWFALLLIIGWLVWRRRNVEAMFVLLLWMLLSVSGSFTTSGWLMASLEEPYLDIDPLDQGNFDMVCLLGGGAWIDRQGQATLSGAGDRILVAAKVYRAGQTPRLICTGDELQTDPNYPSVAEMSADMLVEVGVPREAIRLGPGFNTKTELIALRALVEEHDWKRVGVVTSAWHMGRVERLARDAGVEIVPLPADFRTGKPSKLPWMEKVRRFTLVPNAGALGPTHDAIKEYLAQLVGR